MRASRLLSIMMMLQTRGRMSAEALADELEVSVRTIYRDIDQLSAAGVPVYADIGRNGGFALLDGWRTRLTGLTAPEAQALFLSGLPGPAAELGLGDEVAQAELKLLAALPADWQAEARRMSSRFHLDPAGWFQPGHQSEHLKLVADAVWSERRLAIRYESWKRISDRVIEPLGVVLKGGIWYVVARADEKLRTFRPTGRHRPGSSSATSIAGRPGSGHRRGGGSGCGTSAPRSGRRWMQRQSPPTPRAGRYSRFRSRKSSGPAAR